MSAPAPLEISGVNKSYTRAAQVLFGVDLCLKAGEMFGLIGLNGAGKTTLIKTILDLIRAESGSVRVFGHDSTDMRARANLSYLPEKFQPSRYLKGYEYLDLSLSYYGKKLDRAQARTLAGELDLDPAVLEKRVGSYSKGMGQKLGLLGAFLIDAPLLILDEPMSGLDPRARIRLKEVLLKAKAQGKTVFFSSHILSDIDETCDRIGVIHQGRMCFTGAPDALRREHGEASLEKAFLKLIEPVIPRALPAA